MGQRHQAFAIARIRPYKETQPKYRCVAAFHHQWCYGRLPLRVTRRFITLIKQEENAAIVRAEIQAVHGKFGRFGQEPNIPDTPCPYTAFLLGVAWNIDLENPKEPYVSGGDVLYGLLEAGMGSGDGDNNDGITVIDVTEPTTPAYCFVSLYGSDDIKLPRFIPLTAEQYVREYYPRPDAECSIDDELQLEENVQGKIAQLDGETLVDIGMLAEAWPNEYRASHEATDASDSNPSLECLACTNVLSLADLVAGPAIKHALESGNTTEIENLLWIPGKVQWIKFVLLQQSPLSDNGIALLAKVFSLDPNKTHEDLSSSALSQDQIARLVLALPDVEILDLSFNTQVTIDTVHTVLNSAPRLKRLVLLECSSVSSEDIKNLLTNEPQLFHTIEALIHPVLLNPEATSLPHAFSYIGCEDTGYSGNNKQKLSLPFFTPSTVVQALHDLLSSYVLKEDRQRSVTDNLGVLQAAFSAAPRSIGKRWGERNIVIIPHSLSTLDGLGWTFAVKFGGRPRDNSFFGFLKFLPLSGEGKSPGSPVAEKSSDATETEIPVSPCEIHDLPSFLARMASEGRPAPPEELVTAFAEVIKKMETVKKMRLMTQDDVGSFIELAKSKW